MRAKHSLGQNFLTCAWAAKAVAAVAHPGETVLEIGPGKGALTKELLARGAQVVAYEIDQTLVDVLAEKFAQEIEGGRLVVFHRDIRDVSDVAKEPWYLGAYVVAANIPYYITGEIIRQFLTAKHAPTAMSLLVQKEVAERIAKEKKESILSLSVKAYGAPHYVKTVPASCFSPKPRVDSAIVRVEGISRDFFEDIDEALFFTVVKTGFSSKRKFLVSNLAPLAAREALLEAFGKAGIDEKARAEDVTLPKWKVLVQIIGSGRLEDLKNE